MTPADRIREVLDAHGVDPGTCSLSGPRTLLGDVLDDAMEEHAEAWRLRAWDTLRNLERTLARAEAAEARHRRHLARLRWRASLPKDQTSCRIEPWQTDRLQRRSFLHPQPGYWRDEPSWSPHGDRWTGWVRSWTHGLFDPDVLDYWRRDASAVDIGGPLRTRPPLPERRAPRVVAGAS